MERNVGRPQDRLRQRLRQMRRERAPIKDKKNRPRRKVRKTDEMRRGYDMDVANTRVTNVDERVASLGRWLIFQILRTHEQKIRETPAICLLFSFDLGADPEWLVGTQLGSVLHMVLFKINGALYYDTSDDFRGIQFAVRTGRKELEAKQSRCLYVCNPDEHIDGYGAKIGFNLDSIDYVQRNIPVTMVTNDEQHDFTIEDHRFPHIRQREE